MPFCLPEQMLQAEAGRRRKFHVGHGPAAVRGSVALNVPVLMAKGLSAKQCVVGDLSTVSLHYRNSMLRAWFEGSVNVGTGEAPEARGPVPG